MISAYKISQNGWADGLFQPARSHGPVLRTQGQSDCGLDFDVISEAAQFFALEPEWNALFQDGDRSHQFFQSFDWLAHWCANFLDTPSSRDDLRLSILTGRIGGDLVLIWPLVERKSVGLRTLEWMGAPVSQYGDVVVKDCPQASDWLRSAMGFIKIQIKPDALALQNVRGDSQFSRYLGPRLMHRLRTQQAPFVDLTPFKTFADFRASYSTRTKKTRNRKRRRFMEQSDAHGEIYSSGSVGNVAIDEILKLKRRWLDDRSVLSRAFSLHNFDAFMKCVTTTKTRSVGAMATVLSCDGQLVAGEIGFCHQKTYISHVAAYDLDYARFSPGVLQFEDTVERCFANGITTVDLLAPSDPYKLQWAKESVSVDDYAQAFTVKGYVTVALKSGRLRNVLRKVAGILPRSIRESVALAAAKFL